jgi:argininosuccinate synthase
MADKVVLAYSGGLDTSVSIRWIPEKYGLDVITLTVDVGNERDLAAIQAKALKVGAIKALVVDAKDPFVHYFLWPALQAGALYEGVYPLATALARPLIAKLLVDVARSEGASYVAHGSTGKGNDQVRFDVSIMSLAPDLKIIAPVREWRMTRDEEVEYAQKNNIPITVSAGGPYSVDLNLWGRSIECGVLEDPWSEPPEEVFAWTKPPDKTPAQPLYLEIEFEKGIPVAIDEKRMTGVQLIEYLTDVGGEHGVGRIDHVENRLVGIKSREIYEAPAATILHAAHNALEDLTMSKDAARFKTSVAERYAQLIYEGQWFSSLHQDLAAFVASSQRHVSGTIRVRLHRGTCAVVGRKSPRSLYSLALATYDRSDQFDHSAAIGFIKLWGLPLKVQASVQMLQEPPADLPAIAPPILGKDKLESFDVVEPHKLDEIPEED